MNEAMKKAMEQSLMRLLNDYEREANDHEDAERAKQLSLTGRMQDFLIYAAAIEGAVL